MDEGFHNVLSAICSATLGYCGVLKDCLVEVDTSGRWMKGFIMC